MSIPAFPLYLYLYRADGYHEGPIEITSKEHLYGAGVQALVHLHIEHEVRITDVADFLVFHAKGGQILWPQAGAA